MMPASTTLLCDVYLIEGGCLSINMGLLDWIAKKGWRKDGWDDLTTLEKGFTLFLIFDLIVFMPLTISDLVT